ncbi:MAG: helix-turn-helix transcriptional regulator [Eubacteriales bacterium]
MYEIEYYLEDGKFTYSDGIAYPIRKGYIRIGVPGERCNSLLPFRTKYVKFSAEGMIRERIEAAPHYFQSRHPYEIESMLDSLISLQQTDSNDPLLLIGKLFEFISLVLEDSMTSAESFDTYTIVRKTKQYIETHADKRIRLADIAYAVSFSPNYLHTVFHRGTGMTPREYLTEYRLRHAAELLSTTSLAFSEIAERCGFSSQQYMSTLFRQKFNMSPSQFRRESEHNYLI